MRFTYKPKGTCSQLMEIETEGSKVTYLKITGGCSGNTQGIARLVTGMEIDDVIEKLEGVRCGFKTTSCPDQLAKALKQIRDSEG